MSEHLHMLSIELALDEMMVLARRRKLPLRGTDTGYYVHIQLKELFGDNAPTPFAIRENRGRMLNVLGYSSLNSAALLKYAETYTDPTIFRACNWSSFSSKPMPAEWEQGQRFGFELRACPVVRMNSDSRKHRKGAEVDAFLRKCWEIEDTEQPVDRASVYREWLSLHLDRQGGSKLVDFNLSRFMRQKFVRRRHGIDRKSCFIERPDAIFKGIIEVVEGNAFIDLLGRGIGRHRTFGYGMILLRPLKNESV